MKKKHWIILICIIIGLPLLIVLMRLRYFRIEDGPIIGQPHYTYYDGKVCYESRCGRLENCRFVEVCKERYKVNERIFK